MQLSQMYKLMCTTYNDYHPNARSGVYYVASHACPASLCHLTCVKSNVWSIDIFFTLAAVSLCGVQTVQLSRKEQVVAQERAAERAAEAAVAAAPAEHDAQLQPLMERMHELEMTLHVREEVSEIR